MQMLHLQGSSVAKKNQFFSDWKNYLLVGLAYLNVFREKKPKDHYFKHYNLQLHALQFQNLQTSIVLMDGENMFSIARVFSYDVIPCTNLKDLCKEATWLDLNVNECKQDPNMGSSKMNMFGLKKNVYKKIKLYMVGMYHHTFALIYVQSSFNAYMLT